MKRAATAVAAVLAIACLVGCSLGKPNDSSTAIKVLTQGAYSGWGASSGAITARSISVGEADFAGSTWAGEAAAAEFSCGITFADQVVIQDGRSYTLDGTLNYAISLNSSGDPSAGSFTAYLYSSGIRISGPDYEGEVGADFMETVTWQVTAAAMTMTCVVEGTVGDSPVDQNVSFTFSGT